MPFFMRSLLPAALSGALRSARLALVLLLALAAMSVVGTIPRGPGAPGSPPQRGTAIERATGFRDTFRSPVFLTLAGLLCANVLVCTAHRFARPGRQGKAALPELVLHLSLVLVVAGGAVKAALGSVGTVVVPVGTEVASAIDEDGNGAPLGFALRVEKLEKTYYPFKAMIGLRDPRSGEKIGLVEVVEGRGAASAPGGVSLSDAVVDRAAGSLSFQIATPAAEGRISLMLAPGPGAAAEYGGIGLTLVAYRDEVRTVRALVSTVHDNGLVEERWLSPNGGMSVEGTRISMTAWGADEFGNPFAGFQLANDPGASLFWLGCLLLGCALPAHYLARIHRTRGGARAVRA